MARHLPLLGIPRDRSARNSDDLVRQRGPNPVTGAIRARNSRHGLFQTTFPLGRSIPATSALQRDPNGR